MPLSDKYLLSFFGLALLSLRATVPSAEASSITHIDMGHPMSGSGPAGYIAYISNTADRLSGNDFSHAFSWSETSGLNYLTDHGFSPYSLLPYGTSGNGYFITGYNSSTTHPGLWDLSGNITDLGTLGGFSIAYGANEDGSVATGTSTNGAGAPEAFRWTQAGGIVGLGTLSGQATSFGKAISADGTIITGYSGNLAFRWTQAGGMVSIGTLGGGTSTANAISADGSVIVGESDNGTLTEAFRWTQAGGMVGLGVLGGSSSTAKALSADGSVVVGNYSSGASHAFLWNATDGMRSLESILTGNGIDLTAFGGGLSNATAISSDGNVIAGKGTNEEFYVATLEAITSLPELGTSLEPLAKTGQAALQTVSNGFSQGMSVARQALGAYFGSPSHRTPAPQSPVSQDPSQIQPAAGDESDSPSVISSSRKALFLTGGFSSTNPAADTSEKSLNGTLGMLVEINPRLALGAGLLQSYSRAETYLDGRNRTKATGGTFLASYEAENGLRLYGSTTLASFRIDMDRRYLNGSTPDTSYGETEGVGYSLGTRAGYDIGLSEKISVMPYIELELSGSHLGAYTETGGTIPATVGTQNNRTLKGRAGFETTFRATEDLTLRARAAWGHHISGSAGHVEVSAIGTTSTLSTGNAEENWGEAGASVSYTINDTVGLSGDLSAATHKTSSPDVSGNISLICKF